MEQRQENDEVTLRTQRATYEPESNKLRLYVGRVPRDEYEKLRAEGWASTPKQDCDFVATWTPGREDTALEYSGGVIEDEDQSPQDRAADRAERFAGYRDRRTDDATGKADAYDAGPAVHGYQSAALAERRAARHDMQATRAVNLWGKAEYWQQRTAGVISHALHVSAPGVRMGRIKELEAEQRKIEKDGQEAVTLNQLTWDIWNSLTGEEKPIISKHCAYSLHDAGIEPTGDGGVYTTEQVRLGMVLMLVGNVHTEYGSERYKLQHATLDALKAGEMKPEEAARQWILNHPERPQDWTPGRWHHHITLRLAYEKQMLEAQGGRAAFVEMEPGGFIGKYQVQKVNKSAATGRVVSVGIIAPTTNSYDRQGKPYGTADNPRPMVSHVLNVERLGSEVYRAPTDEERTAFAAAKKAEAAERKATAPKAPSLINPTDEDAERLQAVLNAAAKKDLCARMLKAYGRDYAEDFKPSTVFTMTQAQYSDYSRGTYGRGETRGVCKCGELEPRASNMWRNGEAEEAKRRGPAVCKVRLGSGNGSDYGAQRVIVINDKPQKPLPAAVWEGVQS